MSPAPIDDIHSKEPDKHKRYFLRNRDKIRERQRLYSQTEKGKETRRIINDRKKSNNN